MNAFQRIAVIDSHTAGEPTRVVVAGGPDLGGGPLDRRRDRFRAEHDRFRSCVVTEPRGSELLVGALLCEPVDRSCAAGVIFFNNVGHLGMCGHGTIGLAVTLGHLGRISAGRHRLETPVGVVAVDYDGANRVSFENVPSYCHAAGISVEVEGLGTVTGDVAWGGNWFFIVDGAPGFLGVAIEASNVEWLTDAARRIRQALERERITGAGGATIDHIELCGPPADPANHSRSFVLCPGLAWDRSPCGTGTSAKLACLYARGRVREGEVWRQESPIGTVFEGIVRVENGAIIPRITGEAYITAEATLLIDSRDPVGGMTNDEIRMTNERGMKDE